MTTTTVEYAILDPHTDHTDMSLADRIRAQQARDRAAGIRYTFAPSTPAVDELIAAILGADADDDPDDDIWEEA